MCQNLLSYMQLIGLYISKICAGEPPEIIIEDQISIIVSRYKPKLGAITELYSKHADIIVRPADETFPHEELDCLELRVSIEHG